MSYKTCPGSIKDIKENIAELPDVKKARFIDKYKRYKLDSLSLRAKSTM